MADSKINEVLERLEARLSQKYGTECKIIKLEKIEDTIHERVFLSQDTIFKKTKYDYEVILRLDNMDEDIVLSDVEAARIYGWFEQLSKEVII